MDKYIYIYILINVLNRSAQSKTELRNNSYQCGGLGKLGLIFNYCSLSATFMEMTTFGLVKELTTPFHVSDSLHDVVGGQGLGRSRQSLNVARPCLSHTSWHSALLCSHFAIDLSPYWIIHHVEIRAALWDGESMDVALVFVILSEAGLKTCWVVIFEYTEAPFPRMHVLERLEQWPLELLFPF